MKTTEKTEDKSSVLSDVERKRETISFQVTPQEKTEITYMAVKGCGISVSEFIRTKIFAEAKPVELMEALLPNPFDEEERSIYENKLSEMKKENEMLKDELIKAKVSRTEIHAEGEKNGIESVEQETENNLVINLEPEFKQLFDSAKKYRDELSKTFEPTRTQKEFYDFNKFLKVLLLRGAKRSYYNNSLKIDTGLVLSEFTAMEEITGIDNFQI